MMRLSLTLLTFISLVLFPWPFSAVVVLASSFVTPLLPLAAGLFADTLYYTPKAQTLPLLTLYGALTTIVALFVRSRLSAGIIEG